MKIFFFFSPYPFDLSPWAMIFGTLSVAALVTYFVWKEKTLKQLDPLVGQLGRVETLDDSAKNGTLLVQGELWNFQSDSVRNLGEEVLVIARAGMKLLVTERK